MLKKKIPPVTCRSVNLSKINISSLDISSLFVCLCKDRRKGNISEEGSVSWRLCRPRGKMNVIVYRRRDSRGRPVLWWRMDASPSRCLSALAAAVWPRDPFSEHSRERRQALKQTKEARQRQRRRRSRRRRRVMVPFTGKMVSAALVMVVNHSCWTL